ASLPANLLDVPLHIFRVRDRVTDRASIVKTVVAAVAGSGESVTLMRDWELLQLLNRVPAGRTKLVEASHRPVALELIRTSMVDAEQFLLANLRRLDLSFRYPELTVLAVLWPATSRDGA
ncbi:MAG: hypothetical protein NTW19_17680, partial [Planctomycetota bacterium]|nr:hypothetical protein [Planctomycetota bacterium]